MVRKFSNQVRLKKYHERVKKEKEQYFAHRLEQSETVIAPIEDDETGEPVEGGL